MHVITSAIKSTVTFKILSIFLCSLIAAELLKNEGYEAHNVSDGFSGNGQDLGWKNSGLPCK